MKDSVITKIEWAPCVAQRPRHAGYNARLLDHGVQVQMPLARITTADGQNGFGLCRTTRRQAAALLGESTAELLSVTGQETPQLAEWAQLFEFPLWDLLGQQWDKPVYALIATNGTATDETAIEAPLRVPCYDTSLYIDDLHLSDHDEAAALIADEAREGQARGHRSFKIKVGRGARHMDVEAGTARDIAVIRAVRDAVGPDATIMIDANNGYTLNLTKRVLRETADCNLFWLEEAFHEDRVLYEDLRAWMAAEGLSTLIADGEGQASPSLLAWAEAGIVDVVQYDVFGYGFTPWLETGRKLDEWGSRSAPHHYGRCLGNYVSGHLATALDGFTFVEWDEATSSVLDASAYGIEEGHVVVPDVPGFGLALNEEAFARAVDTDGFSIEASQT